MASDPTTRFTSRVEDYVRFRPGYPSEVFELLERECGLGAGKTVADVGAGTGISARGLLGTGATVVAVEPNAAMRAAIGSGKGLRSVEGTSEATGLPEESIDLVTAFQAFHWFDRVASRREFTRILRKPKRVALVWNERIETDSPFLQGYEAILREHAGDYLKVRHNAISPEDIDAWFGGGMRIAKFPNAQQFDYEGTLGRLMSSSYAPPANDPRHAPMVAALRELFDRTQENGEVEFRYETQAYYGPLA